MPIFMPIINQTTKTMDKKIKPIREIKANLINSKPTTVIEINQTEEELIETLKDFRFLKLQQTEQGQTFIHTLSFENTLEEIQNAILVKNNYNLSPEETTSIIEATKILNQLFNK